MDINQNITNPSADDDLQKAIDNITNTTNIDPVFSDPVAAPSTIPEGDTGELDEPVGPFAAPEINLPAPEPIAPLDAMAGVPELMVPLEPVPVPEPVAIPVQETITVAAETTDPMNMHQIKESALRDLIPLLDHLNMNASQKFNLYRNIFENLRDYTVLSRAYPAAKAIADETERAEALLYLIETIDKM